MLVPSIFGFNDWFDDDFFAPMEREARNADRKLYGGRAAQVMRTDVKETEKGYQVAVDLPGFKKDEISCELKDGYLTISADRKSGNDQKDEDGRFIRRERYYGSASRSFYVGEDLTEDDIHASFTDGVLKLDLPKKDARQQVEDKRHFVTIEG